ncbi:MAG: efflux RND transporter periplasmic adaptor subunit [Kiritimatiellia bacterium]
MKAILGWCLTALLFGGAEQEPAAAVRPVVVAEVRKARPLVRRYAVSLVSRSTVSLSFPVTGKLAVRQVAKDSDVRQGDVLAELDAEGFRQRLAKARYEASRSESSYRRLTSVPRGVSQESVSKAEADMLVAAADLRIAEKDLADTRITAPFDGIVVQTAGDVGQVIPAGTMVTRLHSHAVNVRFFVPERMIARADWRKRLDVPGIEVEVAAWPDVRLPARFAEIELTTDSGGQVYSADYAIDTPPGVNFFNGMSATLFMPETTAADEPAFDVPADALCRDADGEPSVWLVVPAPDGRGRCHRRTVRVLENDFDRAVVTGELADGDLVAVLGSAWLFENREVLPVKERP